MNTDTPPLTFVHCPKHPLTRKRFFYILPPALFKVALTAMRAEHVDEETVTLDRTLGAEIQRSSNLVGFWNRRYLDHPYLNTFRLARAKRFKFDDASFREVGLDPKRARLDILNADESLRRLKVTLRAYCGWLVCNRQFCDQQSELMRTWPKQLRLYGFPRFGPAYACPDMICGVTPKPAKITNFVDAFEQFVRRWKIAQLVGPYLPVPLAPSYPAVAPNLYPAPRPTPCNSLRSLRPCRRLVRSTWLGWSTVPPRVPMLGSICASGCELSTREIPASRRWFGGLACFGLATTGGCCTSGMRRHFIGERSP